MTKLKNFTIWMQKEDKEEITRKIKEVTPNMSYSNFGYRAILQYIEVRKALKDKPAGSFYMIKK